MIVELMIGLVSDDTCSSETESDFLVMIVVIINKFGYGMEIEVEIEIEMEKEKVWKKMDRNMDIMHNIHWLL